MLWTARSTISWKVKTQLAQLIHPTFLWPQLVFAIIDFIKAFIWLVLETHLAGHGLVAHWLYQSIHPMHDIVSPFSSFLYLQTSFSWLLWQMRCISSSMMICGFSPTFLCYFFQSPCLASLNSPFKIFWAPFIWML